MQDDDKRVTPRRTQRGRPSDTIDTQGDEVLTEDDDDNIDSNPYHRYPNSSRRLRDPIPTQNTGGIPTTRRNVNVPVQLPGRIVTPIPTGGTQPRTGRTGGNPNATRQSGPVKPIKSRGKVHWLLYLGLGMMAMLIVWFLGSIVVSWGSEQLDTLRYGNPRTFQIDAVVGHGDDVNHPSHFIAVNLHRHIIIIELKAGNPANSISYGGPFLYDQNGDLIPVTLEFRDVTSDGKPDMLILIGNNTIVFVNTGTQFRPQTPSDHIKL